MRKGFKLTIKILMSELRRDETITQKRKNSFLDEREYISLQHTDVWKKREIKMTNTQYERQTKNVRATTA